MASITIQPGQTLSGLASQYKTDIPTLQKLNPQITDPNKIFAGQNLNLPENTATPTPPTLTTAGSTPPTSAQPLVQPQYPPPTKIAPPTPTVQPTIVNQAQIDSFQNKINLLKEKVRQVQTSLQALPPEQLNDRGVVGQTIQQAADQFQKEQVIPPPETQDVITQGFNNLKALSDQYLQLTQPNQSLVETYNKLLGDAGITADKKSLVDINNVIRGSEQDIRDEVTHAGGFATESQIQGLVTQRNKLLILRSQALSDSINAKEDYVDKIMTLTSEDRKAISDRIDAQFGFQEKQTQLQLDMLKTQASNDLKIQQFYQKQQDAAVKRIEVMSSSASGFALAGSSDERLQQLSDSTNGVFSYDDLVNLRNAAIKGQANKDPFGVASAISNVLGNGAFNAAFTASSPTGRNEAYLASLPGGVRNTVKAMAEYRAPISTSLFRTSAGMKLLNMVTTYDPTFDYTQYTSRQAVRKNFTSGRAADNIRSLNTAIGHIQTLNNSFKQLGNGSFPLFNKAKNFYAQQTGQGAITGAIQTLTAVSSELATIFKNAGATDQEINAWRQALDINASPDQLKSFVNTGIELMGSRLQALSGQWESGMGSPKDFKFIYPDQMKILQNVVKDTGASIDVNSLDSTYSENPPSFDNSFTAGAIIKDNSTGKTYKVGADGSLTEQ